MSDTHPKLSKKARLRWDEREKKLMLLYPERGLLLNETAGEIVRLGDGAHSSTQIVDALVSQLRCNAAQKSVDREAIENDVGALLDNLRERRLIE